MKLKFLKTKLPTVLTIISCIGVVATAISSSKAAIKAEKKEDTVDKVLVYIPTAAIAAGTMACICGEEKLREAVHVIQNPEQYLPVLTCPDCGSCPSKGVCKKPQFLKLETSKQV